MSVSPVFLGTSQSIATTRIPLTMGTGSPIVKVINQEGIFVERGFDPLLSPIEINDEIQITLWASQHHMGPKVHFFDTNLIVMDWVDGKHVELLSLDQIADLAKILKDMHSLPIPDDISQPKQSHFVDKFLEVYFQMEQKTLIPSYLRTIKLKLLEDIKNENEIKLVLCHGDIHANNVLWCKNKVFLIDWTCAGLDYPIVDLAVVSMFWNFTAVQERYLLKSYYGDEFDEKFIQKLTNFKKYSKINWAMWPIMKLLADFPEKIEKLGNILEASLKNPTRRSFEEYRLALFNGSFNSIVRDFDDWIDLHLAWIQTSTSRLFW